MKNTDKYADENVKHYEHIAKDDPQRQTKLKAQRDEFANDAKAGTVLSLSDLMISHGM